MKPVSLWIFFIVLYVNMQITTDGMMHGTMSHTTTPTRYCLLFKYMNMQITIGGMMHGTMSHTITLTRGPPDAFPATGRLKTKHGL